MSLQIDFAGSVWRRERDSNPREIALKRISSAPRYDHFDISPCIFSSLLFLFNLGNWREQQERTKLFNCI